MVDTASMVYALYLVHFATDAETDIDPISADGRVVDICHGVPPRDELRTTTRPR